MDDEKLENRTNELSRREFLRKGAKGIIIYPLLNGPFLKAIEWVYKLAYSPEELFPGEKRNPALVITYELEKGDDEYYQIYQDTLYEIVIPSGGSFNLWIENENWIPLNPENKLNINQLIKKKEEIGRLIFRELNKTNYQVDAFNPKKGNWIRVADLDKNGVVVGVNLDVYERIEHEKYKKIGKARRISVDGVLGKNSELEFKKIKKRINYF